MVSVCASRTKDRGFETPLADDVLACIVIVNFFHKETSLQSVNCGAAGLPDGLFSNKKSQFG
jgi:hypothetical protein